MVGYISVILPWTSDPSRSIQVIARRGILDDIPPPTYTFTTLNQK